MSEPKFISEVNGQWIHRTGPRIQPDEVIGQRANQPPLKFQVGGNHYSKLAIQPVEFIHANNLNFLEGNIVKRACRHRSKNGKEDLLKLIHEAQLLIALEYPDHE